MDIRNLKAQDKPLNICEKATKRINASTMN